MKAIFNQELGQDEIILNAKDNELKLETGNNYLSELDLKYQDCEIINKDLYAKFRTENFLRYHALIEPQGYYVFEEFDRGNHFNFEGQKFAKFILNDYSSKFFGGYNRAKVHYPESDLNYKQRNIIDIFQAEKRSIDRGYFFKLYFDIETNLGLNVMDPQQEIISVAVMDQFENSRVFMFDENPQFEGVYKEDKNIKIFSSEKAMLEEFFAYCENYDFLIGYNSFAYDIPYLENRAKKLGLKTNLKIQNKITQPSWFQMSSINSSKYLFLDLLWNLRKGAYSFLIDVPSSFSLDSMADWLKLEHRKKELDVVSAWKTQNFRELAEYNLEDVFVTKAIDEKLMISEIYRQALEMFPILSFEDMVNRSWIVDKLLFFTKSSEFLVFPSKIKRERVYVSGAYIFDAIPGFYKDVYILDFKSFYPSIILSLNLKVHNHSFYTDLLKYLIGLRKSVKQRGKKLDGKEKREFMKIFQLQDGFLKSLVNAAYGVLAFPNFRFFDPQAADIITTTGRILLRVLIKLVNKKYGRVIYGDTDSVFVTDFSLQDLEALNNEFLKLTESFFGFPLNLEIEAETHFVSLKLMNTKKKYYGLADMIKNTKYDPPKLFNRGTPIIRKDLPLLPKSIVRELVMEYLETGRISFKKSDILQKLKEGKLVNLLLKLQPHKGRADEYKSNHLLAQAMRASKKFLYPDLYEKLRGSEASTRTTGILFVKSPTEKDLKYLLYLVKETEKYELPEGKDFEINYEAIFEKFIKRQLENIEIPTDNLVQSKLFCE